MVRFCGLVLGNIVEFAARGILQRVSFSIIYCQCTYNKVEEEKEELKNFEAAISCYRSNGWLI